MSSYKAERQIADQVVYDGDVDNIEINDEVIRTYCEVIGIDFDNEKDLLWIAEEGMRAPIPVPWKAWFVLSCRCTGGFIKLFVHFSRDTNSDELYYFNFETGESIWDHPLDDHYSKKVIEEREKLRKNKGRAGASRGISDRQNSIESRTQPFPVPVPNQGRGQSGLANTLPPGAKVNSASFGSPTGGIKEDGKRFLKSASKKSSDDDGYGVGAREERIMVDLPFDDQPTLAATTHNPPDSHAYEDDYEEEVDFGDDPHLSEFLLEKESFEPELANLASTGDHETATSQFSQGDILVEAHTTNSGPLVSRPRNPLADSVPIGQSMTATSFDIDAPSDAPVEKRDLETQLRSQRDSIRLELLEEHDLKVNQMKAEFQDKLHKAEADLRKDADEKIQRIKDEIAREIDKQSDMLEERKQAMENAKVGFEEETRQQIAELRSKTSMAVESERKILENREEEVGKRLLAARADIDGEVERKLGTERSLLEAEYAARVAVLRKELAALHETEMSKLRTQLEDANYREQEAKRNEVRAAEQRVSSVKVLESEMAVSLDRRRAELHEEHENTLAKIRRDCERAIATARQESEVEVAKARSEAAILIDDARRKIADETDRQLADVKSEGDRARATALARMSGLEDGLKAREDRVAKRQRELDDLERRLAEKERQYKNKQEELNRLADDLAKEEATIANQKVGLEKRRAELNGIQRSIMVDEMIGQQHGLKGSRKGSLQRPGDDGKGDVDGHSVRSETAESTTKDLTGKRKKKSKAPAPKRSSRQHESETNESEGEEEEEEEEDEDGEDDGTTATSLAESRRIRKKEKMPRIADLFPVSSCSSDAEDDGSKLGRNGKKMRRLLLNLLFPNQSSPDNGNADDAVHAHTSNSSSSRNSKTRRKQTTKNSSKHLLGKLSRHFDLGISEDESDVNLDEIRSRIRAERVHALQTDQRNMLHSVNEPTNPPAERHAYGNTADVRSPYSSYYGRPSSSGDIDRYLSARWYQLYRGSIYSPLRSSTSWVWPLSSSSSKYGYVSAGDLLKQYTANKLKNSSMALYRTDSAGQNDYSKSTVR